MAAILEFFWRCGRWGPSHVDMLEELVVYLGLRQQFGISASGIAELYTHFASACVIAS